MLGGCGKKKINDQEQLRLHVQSHDGISFIPDDLMVEISQSTLAAPDDIYTQEMISSFMSCYTFQDLIRLQTDDPHINKVIAIVNQSRKPLPKEIRLESNDVKRMLTHWDQLHLKNELLCRKVLLNGVSKDLLVLPQSLKSLVLRNMHDFTGHQGIERTENLV